MVSSLSACLKDDPVGDGGGGGSTPDPDYVVYTLGKPTAYSTSSYSLEGLSAICMNEAGNGLYIANDNGFVHEFGFDGTLKNTFTFPSPNNAQDWEGIARSTDGKTIYLSEERTREVYTLNADHAGVTLVSKGPREAESTDNQGYEGIAAGNGILYISNQSKPLRVYTYDLTAGTWGTAFNASWDAKSLSDIYYDNEDGTLWITDAKTLLLSHLKADGTVLHHYDLSSFNKDFKPEGFCKDPASHTMWFVCDQTSNIYKVSYQR